jgi:hypothetical protein
MPSDSAPTSYLCVVVLAVAAAILSSWRFCIVPPKVAAHRTFSFSHVGGAGFPISRKQM